MYVNFVQWNKINGEIIKSKPISTIQYLNYNYLQEI